MKKLIIEIKHELSEKLSEFVFRSKITKKEFVTKAIEEKLERELNQ